jgi:hypothetical protein
VRFVLPPFSAISVDVLVTWRGIVEQGILNPLMRHLCARDATGRDMMSVTAEQGALRETNRVGALSSRSSPKK